LTPPTFRELACALRNSWRSLILSAGFTTEFHYSSLITDPRVDVRAAHPGARADVVEVPAFSLRFYLVASVDDVAKGFDNEYRAAAIQSLESIPGYWPFPTP
jgi:hypothetical protein